MTEKQSTKWQKGQTGNPKGRAPGQSQIAKLRASLISEMPAILERLVSAARGGDVQAAKLILERVLPAVKPIEQPQALQLPAEGTLTGQGRAVLAAIAAGKLAPSQGAALLGAIGTLARVTEIDELTERIAALEAQHGKP